MDLDLAARCRQPVLVRIVAKGAQQAAVIGGGWQRKFAAPPEFVEAGRITARFAERAPRRLVKMDEPLPAVASFGEDLFDAHAPRQRGENIAIVARFADRID